MGVKEMNYFKTRSEPVLQKALLLVARTIIQDLITSIKKSNFYAILKDEVTDISNMCQLVFFVFFFYTNKGKADTALLDCCDLLEHSFDASPDADAIVTWLTKKFHVLAIEMGNLNSFVLDKASAMTDAKGGLAAKLSKDFASTMISIRYLCHRFAPACAYTDDDYKFIKFV